MQYTRFVTVGELMLPLGPTTRMTENAYLSAHRQCLRIGGILLGITAPYPHDLRLSQDHKTFCVDECTGDIEISVERTHRLPPLDGRRIFDSGAVWTLQQCGPDLVFDFTTPLLGPEPYKRLVVNGDFSNARLLIRDCSQAEIDPLEYPTDELLVMNWLAQGRGIEVHGCGFIDSTTGGHLFIGHSSAGKSTTTRLWKSMRGVNVLSDDRIILRRNSDRVWMYGTPWHGECGLSSAEVAAIKRIFVLEHGSTNKITRLSHSQAVAEIFARSFVPFHDQDALCQTLSYLQNVTADIACYRYQFIPDASAVEAILDFCD